MFPSSSRMGGAAGTEGMPNPSSRKRKWLHSMNQETFDSPLPSEYNNTRRRPSQQSKGKGKAVQAMLDDEDDIVDEEGVFPVNSTIRSPSIGNKRVYMAGLILHVIISSTLTFPIARHSPEPSPLFRIYRAQRSRLNVSECVCEPRLELSIDRMHTFAHSWVGRKPKILIM